MPATHPVTTPTGKTLTFWRDLAGMTLAEVYAQTRVNAGTMSLAENDVIALSARNQELVEQALKARMAERRRAIDAILDGE